MLLLLDWEKAFDRVDQEGVFEAMERMNIDPEFIRLTKQLYKNLNSSSKWTTNNPNGRNKKLALDKVALCPHIFSFYLCMYFLRTFVMI